MKVVFLRHGQSEYNIKHLINQDPNIRVYITAKGKKQIADVAKKLEGIEFDAIFVSEFIRTKESAEIINSDRNIPIVIDRRINEERIGMEGKPLREHPIFDAEDFFNFKLEGYESRNDIKKRVGSFLNWLKKEDYNNVLVVTHEGILQIANCIVNRLSDENARKIKFDNAEFLEFEL